MSSQTTSKTQPIILTNAEIKKCNDIKNKQQGLAQNRAIALLLIHVGNTFTQAAEQTDLSIGQVRYLVTAYRKRGISLFDAVSKPSTSTVAKPKTARKPVVKAKATTSRRKTAAKPKPPAAVMTKTEKNDEKELDKAKKKDKKIKDKKSKKSKKSHHNKKDSKKKDKKKKGKKKKSK